MTEKTNKLFPEFPPVTKQQWEEIIAKDLKGADYEKKLIWKTHEGIAVKPYYLSEDIEQFSFLNSQPGKFPYLRGVNKTANQWLVRQDIFVESHKVANEKALDAIARGADSIGFEFEDDFQINEDELSLLLQGIDLTKTEINFVALHGTPVVLPVLQKFVEKTRINPAEVKASVTVDPLGLLLLRGNFCISENEVFDTVSKVVNTNKNIFSRLRIIAVRADHYTNCGANSVQELGFALSQAVEYMHQLTERGVNAEIVARSIKFVFGIGSNYFMEIAKLRAARFLWAKIMDSYQVNHGCPSKMKIHSVTSLWNHSVYDPHVNMLRSTTEAMSAALGGANSISVLPFNATYEKTNPLSERAARNTQLILKEEAYFNQVADPSAGSYMIESLTKSIIDEAWKLFMQVDEAGGFLKAFKAGLIQKQINESAQKKYNDIATRRDTILGVNQFPNFKEKTSQYNASFLNIYNQKVEVEKLGEPLKPFRGAMAFEEVRSKTDQLAKRPEAFMFAFGNLSMQRARAMFACNFFACGGFETIDNQGFKSLEEGIQAVLERKPEFTVICSSDEEYATIVPEIFSKIKDMTQVVVAGAPACMEELKSVGIQHFIHIRSNLLETLQKFQATLKIS